LAGFTRPVKEWIVATNLAVKGDFPIKRISMTKRMNGMEVSVGGYKDRRRIGVDPELKYVVLKVGSTNNILELDGGGGALQLRTVVPPETSTLRLIGFGRKRDLGGVVFDYSLTNLFGTISE
jgi:hypothetical protein